MKIALVDPSLFTWPYDSGLADGLRRNGHEVVLFTKYLADSEPGKGGKGVCELFYPGFQGKFFKSLPSPLFLALKGLMHPISLLRLFWVLRRFRPDVIHVQWAPLPMVDRLFLPLLRRLAPLAFTVHDSAPFNNNPRMRLQALGAIAIMKQFDLLIVHTAQAQKRLHDYGLPAERVVRIPHGALGQIMPALPPAPERMPVTLLLFGILKPYKGADILIQALALLPQHVREKCRVRIAGKAQMDVEPLRGLARRLNVADRIDWDLRFIADAELPGLFAASDISVMPYREIDASGVLMMVLAAGRPVVASHIGLFAELLEDGTHGFLVPPEDPAALAGALATLIEDPARRLAMGRAVRALNDAVPDWDIVGRMTTEAYVQFCTRGS